MLPGSFLTATGLTATWAVLGLLASGSPVAMQPAPNQAMPFASGFRCGTRDVAVGFVGRGARLRVGPRLRDLEPVHSASGAKYADPRDPGTWVWNKGEAITVSLGGTTLPECLQVRSEISPAHPVFRAQGNEPFWSLRIKASPGAKGQSPKDQSPKVQSSEEQVSIVTELGATTLTVPLAPAELDVAGRLYRLPGGKGHFSVADVLCRDTMTGMPYPASVTLTLEGKRLSGCGGDPLALLAGERLTP
jgi:uncharacterized membrane protein/membrane-bound inhibitor of C-type lysozyme